MFALVDCNNFYASCETLFRPDLRGRPVVVLSNNDGCVVARSAEAKRLGIKMGVPAFKIKKEIRQYGIVVFSSNYALYADMSARVMDTLEQLAPEVEVYSIDEAFLGLDGVPEHQLAPLGFQIRHTISRHQGLMVCVGIAPTKTLAKLANHGAKHWPATGGVVALTERKRQRKLMSLLPVNEVWGVGGRLTKRLNALGIHTALDLADTSQKAIHREFNVVLARTVRELNGEPCIPLELAPPPKKQIVCSRSFGERVTDKTTMQHAITTHAWRAAEKLRAQHMGTKQLSIFIRTSPFTPGEPKYSNIATGRFTGPTADARDLVAMSRKLLDEIWRDNYRYAKAGVMLSDICDPSFHQPSLFDPPVSPQKAKVMATCDRINQLGIGKVWLASQGMPSHRSGWGMKRTQLSNAFTTSWQHLFMAS